MDKYSLLFKVTLIYILLIISAKYVPPFNSLFFHTHTANFKNRAQLFIIGKVDNIPEHIDKKICLVLKEEKSNEKILLNIYNPITDFFYGDILKIEGKIKIPQEQRNPGGANQKELLQRDNISIIINTNGEKTKKIGTNPENKIKFYLYYLRQQITLAVKKYLPSPYDSIFLGILLGEKTSLPQKTYELLKKSGIAHILSVSGLHVAILSYIIHLLFSPLPLSMRTKAILNIVIISFYTIMTGASYPVVRAAFMVSTFHIAGLLNRNTDTINSLALALLITLIIFPESLFSTGLILTYTITWSLITFTSIFENYIQILPKFLRTLLAASLAASLAAIPLSMYFFYTFSPISIFLNLLIIPLVGVLMSVGMAFILSAFLLPIAAKLLSEVLLFLITILVKGTSLFLLIPYSYFYVPPPNALLIISYFFLLFTFSHSSNLLKKAGIFQILLVLNFFIWNKILNYNGWLIKINFIDTGQGEAAIINLPGGKNILIDGGPPQNEVENYLRHLGIWEIDTLVISHPDNDHVGGLYNIIGHFPVKKIYFNFNKTVKLSIDEKKFVQWIKKLPKKIQPVYYGEEIPSSPYTRIKVFNPEKNSSFNDANNNSLVLQLKYKNFSILFSGDIGEKAEQRIIFLDGAIQSTILKISHHGSKYSSSMGFLEKVNPEVSIISAGKDNIFGHPHLVTLKKIEQTGSKIYRTDRSGMISITSDGIRYNINKFLN